MIEAVDLLEYEDEKTFWKAFKRAYLSLDEALVALNYRAVMCDLRCPLSGCDAKLWVRTYEHVCSMHGRHLLIEYQCDDYDCDIYESVLLDDIRLYV
jgi:hypothetical protein